MQIVIDIPKSIIEHIKDGSFGARPNDKYLLAYAAMEGIRLPKGHGRLIDADALKQSFEKQYDFFLNAYGGSFSQIPLADKARIDEISNSIAEVVNAPTIIEADEEADT